VEEPSLFEPWKKLDADLFRNGRPHFFEIVGIQRASDAANFFRRFSAFTGLTELYAVLNQFKVTNVVDDLLSRLGFGR
jgi:hypothetical protein